MNTSDVLMIFIMLIFLGLGVFLWYFFKSIEVQLRGIQDSLKQTHNDLWSLEKSLR